MTDLVSVCSRITFGNDTDVFDLPEELIIKPALIKVEDTNYHEADKPITLYRISIGKLDDRDEAAEVYQALFNALDKRQPFVENMHIVVGDSELTIKLAYITKTVNKYGTFYDIEATEKELKYKEAK